ncbi:MAG: biotin--[acetyl-CoA-carboxylase] ligase [Chloroflexi bacterium]|nr:biotin--[acetyl-CoA-carboxylase] ligase [Chloroflexota bacterium]
MSYRAMFSDHLSQEIIQGGLSTSLLGRRVAYFRATGSTMDEARKAALGNAPEGTLVVAEEQTTGRGRFQRTWISPPGVNLYLSLLLRPEPSHASQLTMLASLALARALRRIAQESSPVTIKWPNDVRMGGRKIAGILIESFLAEEGTGNFSIVGMGVNVNFDPREYPEISDIATSLQRELGRPVPRLGLLKGIMAEMEVLYLAIKQGGSVRDEWSSWLDTLGQQVRVTWGGQVYEGYAQGVDQDGSLLLRLSNGSLLALAAGEVTLRA